MVVPTKTRCINFASLRVDKAKATLAISALEAFNCVVGALDGPWRLLPSEFLRRIGFLYKLDEVNNGWL